MPKENKIRILYVQPGKYPEERIIDNTLKDAQHRGYQHYREPEGQ